jgi:conjugative relaxase-like TrwC/TraI family protein
MMSISEALSAAQTATYFDEHYSQDEYYTQGQTCVGRWLGKGAAALGLAGEVSREDFSALLQGINPQGGGVIIPAATHNGEHRAGWDSVFSAPKSVSLQALVGGDGRLMQTHIRAVRRSVAEVEAYALARSRGGRDDVVTGNVVAAAFNHLAARPADNVRLPDPQLHTHVVLLNMTRRPDGAWRALNPVQIYGAQQFASAVYRAELAKEVQRLGYRIQVTAGNGAWELEGYSREQVMAFSQRRRDIEQRMAAQGLSGPKAAQIVALNSRSAKRDYDEQELKADWRDRAETAGIDANRHLWQALGRGDLNARSAGDVRTALDFAKAHATSREAVIDRRALETAALQHSMGRLDLTTVRNQITTDEQGRGLIRAGQTDPHHPQGAFTTDEMLALERENLALVQAGKGLASPIAEPDDIHEWGEGRGMLPDQIQAAELTLTATDWVTAIEGLAGATKTTTVVAIRELAEAQGVTVRGFGPTSGSVKALHEAGIEARTIASLLANPLPVPKQKELWIVDESSLLATRAANQMLKAARDQGVARVVFVGDQRQHHAIEAGAPVRQLLRTEVGVAELTNIRRQRDPELKRAVELAAHGQIRAALDRLEQQGRITTIPESARRYAAIATDYLRGHQAGQRTLVVSPGNDERHALNEQVRGLLVAHGQVAAQGREHGILVRRDLTRPQLQHARNYQEGDVLHFSRGSKRLGLAKDAYVAIERVDNQRNALSLRTPDHREIELNPGRWRGLEAYRWEQRTLAVGDRLQFRAPDRMLKVANGEFATVVGLDAQRATLRLDSKREVSASLAQLRRIDHGYASTSHAAQGATVDRVIVNIDATRSAQLVNRKQFYVSLSRARYDARLYTDDTQALRRAVVRNPEKTIALDVVQTRPTEQLQPARATNDLNLAVSPPPLQPWPTVRITR